MIPVILLAAALVFGNKFDGNNRQEADEIKTRLEFHQSVIEPFVGCASDGTFIMTGVETNISVLGDIEPWENLCKKETVK